MLSSNGIHEPLEVLPHNIISDKIVFICVVHLIFAADTVLGLLTVPINP